MLAEPRADDPGSDTSDDDVAARALASQAALPHRQIEYRAADLAGGDVPDTGVCRDVHSGQEVPLGKGDTLPG